MSVLLLGILIQTCFVLDYSLGALLGKLKSLQVLLDQEEQPIGH